MSFDWNPLLLTAQLAVVTTMVLLVLGLPLAYWLAFSSRTWKHWIEPLISMPLILPPTVLGFYILILLSPKSPLGRFLENTLHISVVFSFLGLVIGSVLFSLPFMVNPIKAAFQSFPKALIEASYVLGKSEGQTLRRVILPNIQPALWTGIVMTFAHTVGEFGVVLMIGGSIPGQTRTASIAVFNEVEALNFQTAYAYSGILLAFSFCILGALQVINRKGRRTMP